MNKAAREYLSEIGRRGGFAAARTRPAKFYARFARLGVAAREKKRLAKLAGEPVKNS